MPFLKSTRIRLPPSSKPAFLNLDREILTEHTDQVADGVVNGILCFVNNENVVPTPAPTSRPMNKSFDEARLAVQKAREALRNNDRSAARQLAEQAAALAPQMEDPWLILAAVASPRCQFGLCPESAQARSQQPAGAAGHAVGHAASERPPGTMPLRLPAARQPQDAPSPQAPSPGLPAGLPKTAVRKTQPCGSTKDPGALRVFPILLLGLGVLVCAAGSLVGFDLAGCGFHLAAAGGRTDSSGFMGAGLAPQADIYTRRACEPDGLQATPAAAGHGHA